MQWIDCHCSQEASCFFFSWDQCPQFSSTLSFLGSYKQEARGKTEATRKDGTIGLYFVLFLLMISPPSSLHSCSKICLDIELDGGGELVIYYSLAKAHFSFQTCTFRSLIYFNVHRHPTDGLRKRVSAKAKLDNSVSVIKEVQRQIGVRKKGTGEVK